MCVGITGINLQRPQVAGQSLVEFPQDAMHFAKVVVKCCNLRIYHDGAADAIDRAFLVSHLMRKQPQ